MNETCQMGILNFFLAGYVFIVFFFSIESLDTGKLVETLETSRSRVSRLTALLTDLQKMNESSKFFLGL
jgi:predicted ABC-type exoprotein transport system permease subunit